MSQKGEYRRATNEKIRNLVNEAIDPLDEGSHVYLNDLAEKIQAKIPRANITTKRISSMIRERDDCKRIGKHGRGSACYGNRPIYWQKVAAV